MEYGLYIGLMSGTSIDSIDGVLVEFSDDKLRLVSHLEQPWPDDTRKRIRQLTTPGENEIDRMGELDREVADLFARCANRLIDQTDIPSQHVRAIGSHGQTIRHRPEGSHPFTLQIGDPNRIAEQTGITVIADFRRRDMATGGEGAPLVPGFHADQFNSPIEQRAILNIGGIANLTLLPGKAELVSGFDSGPGNTLLDVWARRHLNRPRDDNGQWAAGGRVNPDLLQSMLGDPYFERPPPKSTGPEYFSEQWLEKCLRGFDAIAAIDIQATLTALTAETISRALAKHFPGGEKLIVCGGGVHNGELMKQLGNHYKEMMIETTADYGLPPDQVEAVAFAWLAHRTLNGVAGNLPKVTGASHPAILGGIYLA